ncbi:MAG: AI-2E family transporter [Bacteroidota bacterium]
MESARLVSPPEAGPPEPPAPRSVVLQGLLALGGLTALVLLVVRLGDQLHPLLLAAVGAILLWPLRKETAARAVLLALGAVVTVYVVRTLAGVLAPFVGVFVLAYLLNPIVRWAEERWKVPRWASTGVLTMVAVGGIVAVALLLVPAFVGQIERLTASALQVVAEIPVWLAQTSALDPLEAAGLIEREALVEEIGVLLPQQIQSLAGSLPALLGGVTQSVGALLGAVTIAALLPVLLFYSLKDYGQLRDSVVRLLPRYRGDRTYFAKIVSVVGGYLRAQLIVSAISALLVGIPAAIFGLPFALLLGLLAGLLNMVPSLGAILTYVFGIALMLLFGTPADVAIVIAILAVQALIEQSVLTPNVMSQQVGLHPVVVIVSLFIFSAFFGLVGFIIAVPLTALLAGLVEAYREAFVLDLGQEPQIVSSAEAAATTVS